MAPHGFNSADFNAEEHGLKARDLARKVAVQDAARGSSLTCPTPHTVEWRTRSSSAGGLWVPPRAAVCFLGVSRFIDWTRGSIEARFLAHIGVPHDLYTYATPGWRASVLLQAGICEDFLEVEPSVDERSHAENSASSTALKDLLDIATPANNEGAALKSFAARAVAGRIDWDEQPQELLNGSQRWLHVVRRPGGWLGGVRDARGKMRPSAGLPQLRALQWCADSVRWHEQEVLGHEYDYVLFARWDMHWLLPLPSVPLLQSIQPDAVWVSCTQSENYVNDRFAVVPRRHISAYFEGWKLLVSGEVEKAFEAILPRTGVPVFDAEPASTEAFVYVRLTYANVPVAWLPPLAFVQCFPSSDPLSLRTHGHTSCTPFSKIVDEKGKNLLTSMYAGAKYPREVASILMMEKILTEGLYKTGMRIRRDVLKVEKAQWARIISGEFVPWNQQALERCSQSALEAEVDHQLSRGACMYENSQRPSWSHTVSLRSIMSPGSHSCRRLLVHAMKIGLFDDALALARGAVIAAPFDLDNWLWLVGFLSSPPFENHDAALAATLQARTLNPSHRIQTSVDPTARFDALALDAALGGPNATLRLVRFRQRCRRALGLRQRLQQACAARPASTPDGLQAWLRFGELLRRSRWLFAAVGVLAHLEHLYLADLRPEVVRLQPTAPAQVREFEARIRRDIEKAYEPWTIGVSVSILRLQAPSARELVDPKWMAKYEQLTSEGGMRTQVDLKGFSVVWDEAQLRTVFSGVIYE